MREDCSAEESCSCFIRGALAANCWKGQMREEGPVELETFNSEGYRSSFRFPQDEIRQLVLALDLPEFIHDSNQDHEDNFTVMLYAVGSSGL